jgi:predicted O-methyltransferase YrrM
MRHLLSALPIFALAACGATAYTQDTGSSALDTKVRTFLDRHRGTWRDLNVPESDGRLLYDLVLKNGFRRALEIGTSTGHSGVWIAWALSKTGGKLVTIEIDRERHREAIANFKEAGLSEYVEARLGDAHKLVPALDGPFDFVFSDADKEWYTNYFVSVWPKVTSGGCFTAHNVATARQSGIREFLQHLKTVRDGTTTIDSSSAAGVSITCKGNARAIVESGSSRIAGSY